MDPTKRHELLYQASCGPDKEEAKEELRAYVVETYVTPHKSSSFKNKIEPYVIGILISQVGLWLVYHDLARSIFTFLFTALFCFVAEKFFVKKFL